MKNSKKNQDANATYTESFKINIKGNAPEDLIGAFTQALEKSPYVSSVKESPAATTKGRGKSKQKNLTVNLKKSAPQNIVAGFLEALVYSPFVKSIDMTIKESFNS